MSTEWPPGYTLTESPDGIHIAAESGDPSFEVTITRVEYGAAEGCYSDYEFSLRWAWETPEGAIEAFRRMAWALHGAPR